MDGSVKVLDQANGEGWSLYRADCIEVLRGLADASVHYTIFSPPFASLYTFSDDPRDLSNCKDDATFWDHYRFVAAELMRVTMPGRLVSIHCMQLPTSKLRDGFIGLRDFRGEIIRVHQEAGMIYHSEVCIRKDPVSAMQRSKSIGLLHKQVVKDSALSRMAVADYVVTMRKPGDNPEPVSGEFDTYFGTGNLPASDPGTVSAHIAGSYSVQVWQRYAEPVWMDISQSDVLSRHAARAEADERHIAPLQLTVIRRSVDLWSNPGDTVLSPFAGIGSEGYVALGMGRRFIGVELKESYYKQAAANLAEAIRDRDTGTLFGEAPKYSPLRPPTGDRSKIPNPARDGQAPAAKALIEDIIGLCKMYGLALTHEDTEGAFRIIEADEMAYDNLRRAFDECIIG